MKKKFLILILILSIGSLLLLTGCDISNYENETNISSTENIEQITLTLANVTSADYGDIIKLGESANGKTYTWRIFLKDEVNNKVYAIMEDYLPTSDITNAEEMKMILGENGYELGWNKSILGNSKSPEVTANNEAAATLTKENNWSYLIPIKVNGKATAKGSPTLEELNASLERDSNSRGEIKNGKNNLYVLNNYDSKASGYWLSTAVSDISSDLWSVYNLHRSITGDNIVWYNTNGIRPIIILDADIQITRYNEIWSIE